MLHKEAAFLNKIMPKFEDEQNQEGPNYLHSPRMTLCIMSGTTTLLTERAITAMLYIS